METKGEVGFFPFLLVISVVSETNPNPSTHRYSNPPNLIITTPPSTQFTVLYPSQITRCPEFTGLDWCTDCVCIRTPNPIKICHYLLLHESGQFARHPNQTVVSTMPHSSLGNSGCALNMNHILRICGRVGWVFGLEIVRATFADLNPSM